MRERRSETRMHRSLAIHPSSPYNFASLLQHLPPQVLDKGDGRSK